TQIDEQHKTLINITNKFHILEEHKQQHNDMIDFVENMKRTFVRDRDDYENVLKLNIKLMKWYLDHIGNSDKKLGDYLQDKSIKVVVVDDNVNN
ncbi:MAG: hypothetical protein ACP5LO_04950, partial [Calditerrivibrio sp.]|uniref:hypothetical protein n=1 Tax=Calditerrivibrio sp. TaxID=2792612 RepID=UPI003D12FE4D